MDKPLHVRIAEHVIKLRQLGKDDEADQWFMVGQKVIEQQLEEDA